MRAWIARHAVLCMCLNALPAIGGMTWLALRTDVYDWATVSALISYAVSVGFCIGMAVSTWMEHRQRRDLNALYQARADAMYSDTQRLMFKRNDILNGAGRHDA